MTTRWIEPPPEITSAWSRFRLVYADTCEPVEDWFWKIDDLADGLKQLGQLSRRDRRINLIDSLGKIHAHKEWKTVEVWQNGRWQQYAPE